MIRTETANLNSVVKEARLVVQHCQSRTAARKPNSENTAIFGPVLIPPTRMLSVLSFSVSIGFPKRPTKAFRISFVSGSNQCCIALWSDI